MIKKTLTTISYVVLGIFLTVYFTYLNLPYEKIIFKNLPENIDIQASVAPTFLGGLSLENVDFKFPNNQLPLMSKISEVHLGISWFSLLMGNLKLIVSLTNWSDQNLALKNALNLYAQHKQIGTDFSNGPCLGIIAPDWVLDIAHNPRQAADDKPQNQCEDYTQGVAHHFIELDVNGQLIQAH